MLIVFEIAPVDEGLRGGHHADVALDREIALAGAPAWAGAIEDGVMLLLQMRRAFDRHGAADIDVGGVDFGAAKSRGRARRSKFWIVQLLGRHFQRAGEKIGAERPFVEDEFDVEGAGQRLLQLVELCSSVKPFASSVS